MFCAIACLVSPNKEYDVFIQASPSKGSTFEELRVPADGYFSNKTIKGMAVLLPEYERINKQIREFLK